MSRILLLVLDGVGVGAMPDAHVFGDEGSNTLGHVLEANPHLQLPNLKRMGLLHLLEPMSMTPETGSYGRMGLAHAGKDTTGGHWELTGLTLLEPFPTFPRGFPQALMDEFTRITGYSYLGNRPASGTVIIEELGDAHKKTGNPIVYTSADSVFQIAAHEKVISREELYRICAKSREILKGPWGVARVIARPFLGEKGSLYRTGGRQDYSLPPPRKTLLDHLTDSGKEVITIGKLDNIFTGRGISTSYPTRDNSHGIEVITELLQKGKGDFLFANLIDFDMLYGHRNDVKGFGKALDELDRSMPEILFSLKENDLLIITADHGCDPTFPGTDHTREYVPLLVSGPSFRTGIDLGTRDSLADVAATIADLLAIPGTGEGESFLSMIQG